MLDKIKQFFKFASEHGLWIPSAFDPDKPGPSVSLLFAHISFYIAAISVGLLIYKDRTAGAIAGMTLAGLYFIFYMLRHLTKAKIDLKEHAIDLENDEKDSK